MASEIDRAQVRLAELVAALSLGVDLGSGHPPLHRLRLGLEFALSGHREVNDMVTRLLPRRSTSTSDVLVLREAGGWAGGCREPERRQ